MLYRQEVCSMRKYRCIVCKHEFEIADKEMAYKCPKCRERFIELMEGLPVKGKSWGSKSYSVKNTK